MEDPDPRRRDINGRVVMDLREKKEVINRSLETEKAVARQMPTVEMRAERLHQWVAKAAGETPRGERRQVLSETPLRRGEVLEDC